MYLNFKTKLKVCNVNINCKIKASTKSMWNERNDNKHEITFSLNFAALNNLLYTIYISISINFQFLL